MPSSKATPATTMPRPPTPTPNDIVIEQTVTVEALPQDQHPPQQGEGDAGNVVFGDRSPRYQATIVSATAQLTRTLFDTTTLNDYNLNETASETRERSKTWVAVAWIVSCLNFLAMCVDSMMCVMIPVIMYDFDVLGVEWLLAGSAIGAAATILTAGQLYAILPFKAVYMFFTGILLAGTISSTVVKNVASLFFIRFLTGVGIGGQQFGAVVFLERDGTFKDKVRRDFYVAVSSIMGLVIGPIVGALFARRDRDWAWGFYTLFMLLCINSIILAIVLPRRLDIVTTAPWTYGSALTWNDRFARFDFVGCIFSFFGISLLFISLNLAGTFVGWSSGYLHLLLGISGGFIILLVLQQFFQFFASPNTRLVPTHYLRMFKTAMLFLVVFLTSGIFQAALPYTAMYQLLTRGYPSTLATAFYLFYFLTGPFIVPIIIVQMFIGGGLITRYRAWPSYSVWSFVSSGFLIIGTALLYLNMPTMLPFTGGLPTIVRQFALACIGWWSAVLLPIAHQIMDIYRPIDAQEQPLHNRSFILLAMWLGPAVTLTSTGSIFMQLGTQRILSLLQTTQGLGDYLPTEENARVLMMGYTFLRDDTPPDLIYQSIGALENALGWGFLPELIFATLITITATCMIMRKWALGDMTFRTKENGGIPREWLPQDRARRVLNWGMDENDTELEERNAQAARAREEVPDIVI
ncbi:hypothetical protein LTR10_022824 [Elasticomyces elasticus]|uniref:Major facilitator superfamily (MFS) profile domain-containing protein n=1 Tax=Exophiala sideris TaxID=1016849 RepID=A0ABR0JA28_9EURO|nr:hypothetical protein LTR10_022824 [Elasticomyces elasticus]KAK5026164.1 hypothetical protein LTS07_007689 [Exophiala sideris]KAK5032418.1 hypothetical protein LTR13_007241 [Exophiala sideris]KAK5059574.1 hypothetical protein LTR69_006163 [Exophiala sideris]KAK5178143.1 hypothetical protein LTR44_009449 [Eurotiomycetes sp. CCFEE 6388]